MNKIHPILFMLPPFCYSPATGKSLFKIDISQTLKSQTDFKLSGLISHVELLTLKSGGKLILGDQPEVLYFGHSYILIRSEHID